MDRYRKSSLMAYFLRELFKLKSAYVWVALLTIIKGAVSLLPPMLLMKIIDEIIPAKNLQVLLVCIALYFSSVFADSLISYLLNMSYTNIGKKLFLSYQDQCINHLYRLSGEYYTNKDSGDLLTIFEGDISNIKEVASTTIFSFITDIFVAIFMLVYLIFLQRDLFFCLIIIFPIIAITQIKFKDAVMKQSVVAREVSCESSKALQDVVQNVMLHIMAGASKFIKSKYIVAASNNVDMGNKMLMMYSLNEVVLGILSSLLTILVLGVGGFKVFSGALTIGGLMAFNVYTQKLIGPVMRISNVNVQLQSFFVSLDNIYKFLEVEEAVHNNENLLTEHIKSGEIQIKGLSFGYGPNTVLKNVSAEFRPHTINAIVGESGMGKSTITYLLYRLWEYDGKIEIDGVDIRMYDINYLRNKIGIVSQNTYILDDTILNNLVLQNKELEFEKVEKVCKMVCIHDYSMSLPQKYNTVLGENGVKLSGGQKQRLALARILLKDMPILILDEATSALDPLTEQKVYDNIQNFFRTKTVIIITHRLSTIKNADVIYVLRNQQIKEKGTHDTLIQKKGYYYQLYNRINNSQIESIA